MKLRVLGTLVLAGAVMAGLAAQGTEQTIMGCVKGDGTDANPWMLTGVVIPPPPPAAPAGGGGRGGGRAGGRGDAAPPAAGGAPPAARGGEAPPAGGAPAEGRGGRGGGRGPAAPPPPPPPPVNFKLNGVNMTPWNGMRAEVTGTGTTAGFNVSNVRSMWGTCPPAGS